MITFTFIFSFTVFLPVPQKVYTLPPTGSVDFITEATDEQKTLLQSTLDRLREQINQKRLLVKPCFKDFDRLVNVYVSYYSIMIF